MKGSQPSYAELLRFLSARTGLSFPSDRQDRSEQAIQRAMTRARLSDFVSYQQLLQSNDGALDDLISEITVGETYFFREPAQYGFIIRVVLPDVVRRYGREHGIRAWSAACASGEEAYSLAMALNDVGLGDGAYLLATDISRAALAKAGKASYQEWSLRGDEAERARPYLRRIGNRYVVQDALRRKVNFEYFNLAANDESTIALPACSMDLILCRNVLIYFDPAAIKTASRRLFDALAPGGWLILASSDPPPNQEAPFEVVVADEGIFYRRPLDYPPSGIAASPTDYRIDTSRVRLSAPVSESESMPALSEAARGQARLAQAREAVAGGNYRRAVELTREHLSDEKACAVHIRALANVDAAACEQTCARATEIHPLSVEIHLLHAAILLEVGQVEPAIRAARRAIYLDRTSAAGHFTLATVLWRKGDRVAASRAFRNARILCEGRPAGEEVPLSGGESAGRMADAAANYLAILESTHEVSP